MTSGHDLLASRRGAALVSSGIVILFLIPRLALLFGRDAFFDELFTRWIAAHSFAGILHALRYDSGPPLYYFIVHALGDPPLVILRAISLVFATASLFALLSKRCFAAAALLAVFPPAVLFAVDARAYALCAMFVTFGVLANRPYSAALWFVAAAYSHYYGALFIPLLLLRGAPPLKVRVTAFGLALLLFAPGIWLALHQPRGSMAWIGPSPLYPEALFVRPPLWLTIIAAVLLIAAAIRVNRFTAMTLLPLGLALALRIYFPFRFEAVIAAPLVLWLGTSARRALVPALVAVGLAICALGIVDHLQRPIDDYRDAALHLRAIAKPGETVVASGYLYLEAVSAIGDRVQAFPREQALHPGWRAVAPPGSTAPSGAFLWIGERLAPELVLIRNVRRVTPIYGNDRAVIVKVN
jgi:hypothetical protein